VKTERTTPRFKRLVAALVAVPLAAVVLTTAPVGAAPAADGADAVDGAELVPANAGARSAAGQVARTTTGNAEIDLPEFTITPCPEITDSIVRLYSAYFLRAPDEGGFDFWLDVSSNGTWSLPRMSAHFSQSAEFLDTYGSISDSDFINLIYINVLGRAADQGGLDFWLGRMATEGLDRGTVMLFFSESPEYIDLTLTSTPLAGEFNWYPEGTRWSCGFDNMDVTLPSEATWVDVAIYNDNARPNAVTANLLIDGQWQVWDQATIEQGEWFIFLGVEFDNSRVTGIELLGSEGFIWTVVYSPTITPPVRAGWVLF